MTTIEEHLKRIETALRIPFRSTVANTEALESLTALRKQIAEMERKQYAHMCRDGHQQIGHNDSEHERCPLCRVMDERDEVTA